MGDPAIASNYSIEEYLKFETESELRHEYHDGEIFAMAGGTHSHGLLGTNILTELNLICRNKPCKTFNGDIRIRIDAENKFVYPEASVVCEKVQDSPLDPHAVTNPLLIVEVLSNTTEAYDRGEKFRLYRNLPSFKEYLLIDQHRPIVSIFSRKEDNIWEMREVIGLTETLYLQSLEAEIKMEDLYRKVEDLKG